MQQKVINFHQFIINNIIFYKISKISIKPAPISENHFKFLPLFYDMGSSSLEPVYFMPVEYCTKFRNRITTDITSDTLAVAGSANSDKRHVINYDE